MSTAACTREAPAPAAPPPPLTVVVVIDQLRGDELVEYESLWRYGLARLTRDGRVYTAAMHGQGRTETASGHASLATGVHPRVHGVVDKYIYDAAAGRLKYVCDFGDGECDPDVLVVPTLGDRLKDRSPQARVVAIAQKSRSAMLLGGRRADLVAWMAFEPVALSGRYEGAPGVPGWLQVYFEQLAAAERIGRLWELPRLPKPFADRVDAHPGEYDPGHGTTFPHRIPRDLTGKALYYTWFYTPDTDRVVLESALRIVRRMKLGQPGPDLLLVSAGGFDAIGHAFGPDSLERIAALTELDRQLGDLLDGLADELGQPPLVALSSDHGVDSPVKVLQERGIPAGRVRPEELVALVERALSAALGPRRYVLSLPFPFLVLTELPEPDRRTAARLAAGELSKHPGVYRAWPIDELGRDPDPIARLMAENVYPGRSGDVVIALEEHWAPWSEGRRDAGAEHGSPWKYDRHVPIVLWGNGVKPGRVDRPVQAIDLTRTLADRLHLPKYPEGGLPLP